MAKGAETAVAASAAGQEVATVAAVTVAGVWAGERAAAAAPSSTTTAFPFGTPTSGPMGEAARAAARFGGTGTGDHVLGHNPQPGGPYAGRLGVFSWRGTQRVPAQSTPE